MSDLTKFKLLIKKYKTIFSDILGDMQLEKVENNEIVFKNKKGEYMTTTVMGRYINFDYKSNWLERRINFRIPDKGDDDSDIKVLETIRENRPNGCIIEQVERMYGFSIFSMKEKTLVDLVSKRYVFSQNVGFVHSCSEEFLEKSNLLRTVFESHMNISVKSIDEVRWCTDSKYSSKTLLNGVDISHLYDIVEGKDKINRIYDLYNGIINKRNSDDIFSIHLGLEKKEGFGYKEASGITEQENSICGTSYNKFPYNQDCEYIYDFIQNKIGYKENFSIDDLNSLLDAITYTPTIQEIAVNDIEKRTGMSYKEFNGLDIEEQIDLLYPKPVRFIKKIQRRFKRK